MTKRFLTASLVCLPILAMGTGSVVVSQDDLSLPTPVEPIPDLPPALNYAPPTPSPPVAVTGATPSVSWSGQTSSSRFSGLPESNMRVRRRATVVTQHVYEPIPKEERERLEKWRSLQRKIRDTKDAEVRKGLGTQLKTLVEEIFDKDLAHREQHLRNLEERVQKLRSAIEKRRTNRDRIIHVQVDSVLLDAEGLSFLGNDGWNVQQTAPNQQTPWQPVTGRDDTTPSRAPSSNSAPTAQPRFN